MLGKIINRILNYESQAFFKNKGIKQYKLGKYLQLNVNKNITFEVGEYLDLRDFCSIRINNGKLKIGHHFFMNNQCSINCLYDIEIGNNVLFGEGVKVYDHNHQYRYENNALQVSSKDFIYGAVKIGDNCWLGSNVVVLKGVTIGNNTIIGAGCVIYKDVPAKSIIVNDQKLKAL